MTNYRGIVHIALSGTTPAICGIIVGRLASNEHWYDSPDTPPSSLIERGYVLCPVCYNASEHDLARLADL